MFGDFPDNPEEALRRFFLLFDQRRPGFFRFAFNLCRNHCIAEDLVSDAFLNAANAYMVDYRRIFNFGGYVNAIIRNLYFTQRTAEKRKVTVPFEDITENQMIFSPKMKSNKVDFQFDETEIANFVLSCAKRILRYPISDCDEWTHDDFASALVLWSCHEMTPADIVDFLQLPNTLKMRKEVSRWIKIYSERLWYQMFIELKLNERPLMPTLSVLPPSELALFYSWLEQPQWSAIVKDKRSDEFKSRQYYEVICHSAVVDVIKLNGIGR